MSETFETMVEQAWDAFGSELLEVLQDLDGRGVSIRVHAADGEAEGLVPFVTISGYDGFLLATVAEPEDLVPAYALDEKALATFAFYGWEGDDELPVPHLSASQNDVHDLVAATIGTLRNVHGVVHPRFLDYDFGDRDLAASFVHFVVEPGDRDELIALVGRALEGYLGDELEPDEDGDFGFRWGSAQVYVRVRPDAPVVQVFSQIVHGIRKRAQAAIEVNLLNRDTAGLKFTLSSDAVLALSDLPALPFSSLQFHGLLGHALHCFDELSGDLVERVGGRPMYRESDC